MSVTVAVMNAKGGVGKSTTTMMLAEGLCTFHGARTLVIDSDPQASVSLMLVGQEKLEELQEDKHSLADVLTADNATEFDRRLRMAIQANVSDVRDLRNLSLLPSSITLAWVDRDRSKEPGKFNLVDELERLGIRRDDERIKSLLAAIKVHEKSGTSADKAGESISERIASLVDKTRKEFDYVLVDCPPSISVITESWLARADFYLAPAKPDYLSVVGLGLLGQLNIEAGVRGETFAANLGTLITMRRTGNKTDDHWTRKLHREAPFRAFPMEVGLTVHIARAGEFAPERRTLAAKYPSPLTGLIGELSQEFVHRIGKAKA